MPPSAAQPLTGETTLTEAAVRAHAVAAECLLFARYLTGQAPPRALLDRYVRAHTILLLDEARPGDLALVAFARKHPWSLPFLDAALGLLEPRALLRKKLLVTVALLETTPEFTDWFFPQRLPPVVAWLRIVLGGLTSLAKTVVGLPLYLVAMRAR